VAGERRVAVRARHPEVVGAPATGEVLACSGVSLVYYVGGQQVAETWIPAGDRPSVTDDELLIDALRRAVLWNEPTSRPPRPSSRNAVTSLTT
jgi:hypothetical protein